MKNAVKLLSFALMIIFSSCNNQVRQQIKEFEMKRQAEKLAEEARLKQYADSTVTLSFKGVELGEPLIRTMQEARKKGEIYSLSYNKDRTSATCKAKINISTRDNPLEVDIMVASYQDTITSFVVMMEDYDARYGLEQLYKSKYNADYATREEDAEYWGDRVVRSKNHSMIWTFKNQSVRYTTFLTEKRENYVKNPEMRSPENRYGIRYTVDFKAVTIIYTDFHHCKKVEEYENEIKKEEERLAEIEKAKTAKADSIKREEQRRKVYNQDI